MLPIRLRGARTHNLKSIDLDLHAGQLTAIAGVSGAGKSSLAMDTLYSEGQRRFVESFSPYARQFLERMERPPMDSLDPVAAGVAVDRKAPIKSSRSTVATMTDVEPYLSALFFRESSPYCDACGRLAERADPQTTATELSRELSGQGVVVTFPVRVAGVEGYLDQRDALLAEGFSRCFVSGKTRELDDVAPSEILAAGSRLDVVVDRLVAGTPEVSRLSAALEGAWRRGHGQAHVHLREGNAQRRTVTQGLSCPGCGKTFAHARVGLFSYQSPVGACAKCRGFGRTLGVDWAKVIPDERVSIEKGAIRPWFGKSTAWERKSLMAFCARADIPTKIPWSELSEAQRKQIVDGEGGWKGGKFPGIRMWFEWLETRTYKMHVRVLLARYRSYDTCSSCAGKRLSPEALTFRLDGLDLGAWHALEISAARAKLEALTVGEGQGKLAQQEIVTRLRYLEQVGLGYLSLDRQSRTLSGGEAQRVSLTAALGTSLTGALFVLDEPTVGLHPADLPPLIAAMKALAARGNAAIVIEHELDVLRACDRVVELGPAAGADGGEIVSDGSPTALARGKSPTATALRSALVLRNEAPIGPAFRVVGAKANNLRDVTVSFPLSCVVAVTGVSGSGKSTLVEDIVYRALARARGYKDIEATGAHQRMEGTSSIRSVVLMDQAPLGRTSRGNAATYTGAWSRIRALFAQTEDAVRRGYEPGHFSFNVALGRCEACDGEGAETVEMQFLADVTLTCPLCKGKRFKEEVLAVKLRGLNVAEVLEMPVRSLLQHFDNDPTLLRALGPLVRLGLGYLPLGQPLSTLSGGEAQRLKLARALTEVRSATLFVLDEPSAGLHASETPLVLDALRDLVRAGGSVIIVEHDLSLIAGADWVIELGPGAGRQGGLLVAEGTSATVATMTTPTGLALAHAARAPAKLAQPSTARVKRDSGLGAIEVRGAREHNLGAVDVDIPHGALTVVTGPSGSGKSTLAFDVVFAEGQRRFLETLTPYARQFLPALPKPDVDRVMGVPPSIALEQRTSRSGANSTVATVTEIAHFLRLLFAKIGTVHCPTCDVPVVAIDAPRLVKTLKQLRGECQVLSPAVVARKGHHTDVFEMAARAGIREAWIDGRRTTFIQTPKLDKRREHTIEFIVHEGKPSQMSDEAIQQALAWSRGVLRVTRHGEDDLILSTLRACQKCGQGVPELDPRWFSFNTKQGQCEPCRGTGIEGGPDAAWEGVTTSCGFCEGSRLAPIPRGVRLSGRRYHEIMALSMDAAAGWAKGLTLRGDEIALGAPARKELERRLDFVLEVGLGYLGLGRRAATLSGGEMQRLRLAAQLGSGLTGALYVLDEPTIGLHPRDTQRLLENLTSLVKLGSTVIMVEHDLDCIAAAEYLVDMGPGGGRMGGHVQAAGSPKAVLSSPKSPTAQAIANRGQIFSARTRLGASETHIELLGAKENNLQGVNLRIPTGRLTAVTGVSGSGKSTLVRQVLYPAARRALGLEASEPGAHRSIRLPKTLGRALAVDQSPIGRTPRSVPATFLGIWDEIRKLLAATPDARAEGFTATRFSFNSGAGGRCPSCEGQGVTSHEMAFMPDVTVGCEACDGMRFEPRTLAIRYLDKSAGEILRMSAEEAVELFSTHRKIAEPLRLMCAMGLGYLQIGQGSHTLSGGEAQRVKLAAELTQLTKHKATLYVLDEPTTGLHLSDVGKLMGVLDRLVQRGDTVVVIEHHPAVIWGADHVVELGPEGGAGGGRIIAEGSPEALAKLSTPTGKVLSQVKKDLKRVAV